MFDDKECNHANNNNNNKFFISLGNYCLSSMLLKENNIKHDSYPFDWMVNCIDTVHHCIENNFSHFLNKENYLNIDNKTQNKIYFEETNKLFGNLKTDHQHHNLLDNKDYEYLTRCVERFNNLDKSDKELVFVMIQPLYLNKTFNQYEENKIKIKNLFNILKLKFKNNIKLIIFTIKNEDNQTYKEEIIYKNLKIIELDSKMVKGNYGMMYFDKNGIKKFLEIIQND